MCKLGNYRWNRCSCGDKYIDKCICQLKREYIDNVKSQLHCNASQEYSDSHVTYLYSNEQIDDNLDYFEKCRKDKLSAYKSLLFFEDYLTE